MLKEYEKISTVFERATDGSKKLIDGLFRDATVHYLANNMWEWTEKVDGTNIRVYWDGHNVSFHGRTDRAQIPSELVNKLNELFGGETNAQIFEQLFGEKEVILFGEGYGRKIQAVGSSYIPDGVNFILFDVLVGNVYLKRDAVIEVGEAFNLNIVPVILSGTVYDAIDYVKEEPESRLAPVVMEGLVGRPPCELRDRLGNRVILKIKVRDFKHE